MHFNTITVKYVPVQVDIWTEVTVKDHFGTITAHKFEEDEQANEYIQNLPGDYFVYDSRTPAGNGVATGYYVRDKRL